MLKRDNVLLFLYKSFGNSLIYSLIMSTTELIGNISILNILILHIKITLIIESIIISDGWSL